MDLNKELIKLFDEAIKKNITIKIKNIKEYILMNTI